MTTLAQISIWTRADGTFYLSALGIAIEQDAYLLQEGVRPMTELRETLRTLKRHGFVRMDRARGYRWYQRVTDDTKLAAGEG